MVDFQHHRDAIDCLGQGYLTNSKMARSHVMGVYPTHVARGEGARLYDYDGEGYLDYICGLGTNLFGYANPLLVNDLRDHLDIGFSHSFPTRYEIDAANSLKSIIQFVEKIKFVKTGSEACSAALIMARAFTGRTLVYSDGYHGFHSEFTSLAEPALGCIKTGAIARLPGGVPDLSNVAAVIVEPVVCDYSDARKHYLLSLKDACTKSGTILIFDEIITGFRFPKYCVSQHWRIEPDLLLLGKAIAGGLPLAAICGKKEILDGNYFVSSTYAGEILSLRACIKTVDILCRNPSYKIDELWAAGEQFITEFNKLSPERIQIEGYPTRGRFIGDESTRHLFFQEACKARHLFGPSFFYNFALVPFKDHTIKVCTDILFKIKSGQVRLEGERPTPPFAEQVRHGKRTAS